MRFPTVFYRFLGITPTPGLTPNTQLGLDVAPSPLASGTVSPGGPTPEDPAPTDCVLPVKFTTAQGGFPQRIAVLYGYVGAGAAPALTGTLYFLEETTGLWFVVGTAATLLAVGGVTYFDCLSIADGPAFGGGRYPGLTPDQTIGLGQASAGSYHLLVNKVGSVNGQYYFGMAAVLTSNP